MLGALARAAHSLQTQDRQRRLFADGKVTLPYETYIAPHTRPVSKIRPQLFVSAPDALGNSPFVLLNSWSESAAPTRLTPKQRVVEELEEKRQAVLTWWIQFKATQQRRVKDLIYQSFARTHGSP
jgi:hypothetical protein